LGAQVSEDSLQRSGTGRLIHQLAEFWGAHGLIPNGISTHFFKKSRQAPAMSMLGITLNVVSSCRQDIFSLPRHWVF